jgi:hypothetical protein
MAFSGRYSARVERLGGDASGVWAVHERASALRAKKFIYCRSGIRISPPCRAPSITRSKACGKAAPITRPAWASGICTRRFAEDLLEEQRVSVLPGEGFGNSTRDYVRLSLAQPLPYLEESMDRIERFVNLRSVDATDASQVE